MSVNINSDKYGLLIQSPFIREMCFQGFFQMPSFSKQKPGAWMVFILQSLFAVFQSANNHFADFVFNIPEFEEVRKTPFETFSP